MLLAENYFPLKLAEAWKEISIEFQQKSFVPHPTDQQIISMFLERMETWTKHIKTTQLNIFKSDTKKVYFRFYFIMLLNIKFFLYFIIFLNTSTYLRSDSPVYDHLFIHSLKSKTFSNHCLESSILVINRYFLNYM